MSRCRGAAESPMLGHSILGNADFLLVDRISTISEMHSPVLVWE